MNFGKLFQGIVGGGLFSGLFSAICAIYISFTSNTVGSLGFTAKDFWWLAMALAGLFGLIVGGILGAVISELNLSLISAGICGFLIAAIPGIFFLLFAEGKYDENIRRFGIAFIFITTLTAIFVSFIQTSFFKNE